MVGIEARMRESSTTLPSASGTLKWTRPRNRFARVRGGAEGRVELLNGGRTLQLRGEVNQADGWRRDAQAEAVELALEVGDDERQRLGRTGRGGDDVLAGRARPARVLVGHVEDALVVRIGVDRVHQAAPDGPAVVHDLRRRRQAVGGAAGVADDVVALRIVGVLVDAEDDGHVLLLRRCADDDLLRAGVGVRLCLLRVGEEAGGLDHDVHPQIAPGQLRRVLDLQHPDLAAIHDDRVVRVGDGPGIGAVGRVVLEEQGVHLRVHEIVDRDDLDRGGPLEERLERLPTDATEAVDADTGGHESFPPAAPTGAPMVDGWMSPPSASLRATRGCDPKRPTSSPRPAATMRTRRAGTRKPKRSTSRRAGASQRSPWLRATLPPTTMSSGSKTSTRPTQTAAKARRGGAPIAAAAGLTRAH